MGLLSAYGLAANLIHFTYITMLGAPEPLGDLPSLVMQQLAWLFLSGGEDEVWAKPQKPLNVYKKSSLEK